MKQTATILLMTILAFNWVGYRLLTGFMERKADIALDHRIDKADYDESSLIELRVPLNAPYLSGNTSDFERVYGEIEIEGTHYNYVKRKVVNGELVLLCLPNEHKMRLQNSRMEFFKLVNDLNQSSQNSKEKNTASFKTFAAEYKSVHNAWEIVSPEMLYVIPSTVKDRDLKAGFNTIPEQPPKA